MTRRPPGAAILFVAAVLLAAAGFSANRAFYHDDAFITLRYCRNFIQGEGIVWNPGERVEGYTNFLHLILISLLGRLGVDLAVAARVVSGCAFAGLGAVLSLGPRKALAPGGALVQALPAFLTLTSFPLIVWTLGGLEAPLFSFLSTLGIILFLRALWDGFPARLLAASGAAFALASMTRIDGLIFVGVTAVFALLPRLSGRPARNAGVLLGAFACLFCPYFLWRFWYYGDLLPNTFYVKGSGIGLVSLKEGLRYAIGYFLTPPFPGPLLAVPLAAALFRRSASAAMLYTLACAGAYLAYIVSVGGDHMTAYRFIVPVIPALALLLAMSLRPPADIVPGWLRSLVCAAAIAASPAQLLIHALNPVKADTAEFIGTIVGRHIESAWPTGALVALNTAGSTPYNAPDLRFLDMLGLNDRHIAHRPVQPAELAWQKVPGHGKGDGAYVLSRRPDYIIIGPAWGTTVDEPWFLSDLEISRLRSDLEASYRLVSQEIDVRNIPGHERYEKTAAGTLRLTYYERIAPAGGIREPVR